MTTPDPVALLNDPALEGMTEDEKRSLLDMRISSLRTGLAGVLLDGATNDYSVDIPADQRRARKQLLAKQEQSLRDTLTALRRQRASIPDDEAKKTDNPVGE